MTELVIIGGGPAGISASISASRLGAKVLLIEKDGVLGGMSGAGMLNVWCGNAYSKIFEKVIKNIIYIVTKNSIFIKNV